MSKLPPEEVNGVMHQPVECSMSTIIENWCAKCQAYDEKRKCAARCLPVEREDGLSVYFVELEDE